MGLDINWGDAFGNVKQAVNQGLSDLSKTAVPALQASLEQWGIDVLTKQHEATTKELEAGIKEVTGREAAPGSFGALFGAEVKNASLAAYAPWIIGGIAVLLVAGYMLRGK